MRIRTFLFFLNFNAILLAQNEPVKGVIRAGDEPVSFASLKFKNSSKTYTTYSDEVGAFALAMALG